MQDRERDTDVYNGLLDSEGGMEREFFSYLELKEKYLVRILIFKKS